MHDPIQIKNFSLSFPHKVCFDEFSTIIYPGDRIGIIGRNGVGKSCLLKMIKNEIEQNILCGYISQICDIQELSGGERFNKALSGALGKYPHILLLDEPTNHLDLHNRNGLMKLLSSYHGTLIIATHDKEILNSQLDILWHINQGKVTVFHGRYQDYSRENEIAYNSAVQEIKKMEMMKKDMHQKMMKEQERISKNKAKGEKKLANNKWGTMMFDFAVAKAEKSQGRKKKEIDDKKNEAIERLSDIYMPEVIIPTFSIPCQEIGDKILVSVVDGSVSYGNATVLENINMTITTGDRVAIQGRNASGKTTLLKAIMHSEDVTVVGRWMLPDKQYIGYLDQHYDILNSERSPLETISQLQPSWSHAEIRKHLNNFLFRKNEEVNAAVKYLSGGERARLSLAYIAANIPKLLVLDEITNNLDMETKDHVAQVLKCYPGTMIIVSHDEEFLKEINCSENVVNL